MKWLRYYLLFRPLATLPMPLPWAYRAAGLIARIDRRRQPDAEAAVLAGLRQVFPDRDQAWLNDCLNAHFGMFARELLDVFTMRGLNHAAGQRLVQLKPGSLQRLHEAGDDGRGVIIAMSHYGRVNMLLFGLALVGSQVGMLTMAVDHRNPQLDAVDRAFIGRKIATLLRFTGGRWVTLNDDLRALYQALRGGEILVILLDAYSPERAQHKLDAPFLGGQLRVSRGIARLAAKTGARVLYGVAHDCGDHVDAELRTLPDAPEQALLGAVAEFERDLQAAPWQWWQWGLLGQLWTPSRHCG